MGSRIHSWRANGGVVTGKKEHLMATAPQWKVRRLASRAVRVVERRGAEDLTLKAFETTLIPVANQFIASYDGIKRFNAKWQKELREGHGAVADLIKTIRKWLPRLAADIPHFDRSTFADTAVPDDVIEDAQRLRETIEDHQELQAEPGSGLKPLGYASALLADLETSFGRALKEWREAETADSAYQQALERTRRLAGEFFQELIAFRETLASVVGRSDTDYQKLRTSRATTQDTEDDPNAPVAAVSSTTPTT
jgi:hypothetical protein